jgi:chorismate lyase
VNDDSQMWLPGHALNCYEGDARLRSWLLTPGLLTERIRDAAGAAYRMTLVYEGSVAGGDGRRDVEMSCGATLWMFARSQVPATTLARQPWLGQIGGVPLGAALAERAAGIERSEFSYALLQPDQELVAIALERARIAAQALWVRRSTFLIDGAPLHLREVFMPSIGVPAASASIRSATLATTHS